MKRETLRYARYQRDAGQQGSLGRDILAGQAEILALRAEVKRLRALVALLPDGYPDGEWEGFLHEEGCNGVRHRRYSDGTRDEDNECKCDGDHNADRIRAALRPLRKGKR